MNRAEHRAEAERILQDLHAARAKIHGARMHTDQAMAINSGFLIDATAAQVHATLATLPDETDPAEFLRLLGGS